MYCLGIVYKQLISDPHISLLLSYLPVLLPSTYLVAVYLLGVTIPWSHQYFTSKSISFVSSVKELRSAEIRRFAELKIRSISADIAGIDRTSNAMSREVNEGWQGG